MPGRRAATLLRHYRTGHLRHHHVRQQQMNGAVVLGAGGQGVFCVARFQDLVSPRCQRQANQRAHPFLVFDHQDRFRPCV